MEVTVKAQFALECLKIARTMVDGDHKLMLEIAKELFKFVVEE